MSRVRPAGAPLGVMGGRASGPAPLKQLFDFFLSTFKQVSLTAHRKAQGRRLHTNEVHNLICNIAEVVVVGGVRRSALISLSDLSDDRMRHCKSGEWWSQQVFDIALTLGLPVHV